MTSVLAVDTASFLVVTFHPSPVHPACFSLLTAKSRHNAVVARRQSADPPRRLEASARQITAAQQLGGENNAGFGQA